MPKEHVCFVFVSHIFPLCLKRSCQIRVLHVDKIKET